MTDKKDLYFGQIAINRKLVTKAQVEECLQIQKQLLQEGKDFQRLGELLVQKGYISIDHANSISKTQQKITQKHDALLGKTIAGYRIHGILGRGGMGTVYRAEQLSMSRLVALKVLKNSLAQDKTYIQRFIREARSAGAINHQNIIRVHDVGNYRGLYYFSMELVEGKSVQQLIHETKHLPHERALEIITATARALEIAARHDIIHRDIKPENILLTKQHEVKLADMGLAKKTTTPEEAGVTQGTIVMGTPFYMSPEQATDSRKVDQRADIFSLGSTFYHMLTGRVPFHGDNVLETLMKVAQQEPKSPKEIIPTIPQGYCQVIRKMMHKDPEHRYQTHTELIADLKKLKRKESLQLPRDRRPATARLDRMRQKRIRRNIAVATLATLFTAAGILLFLRILQKPAGPPIRTPPDAGMPVGVTRTGSQIALHYTFASPEQLKDLKTVRGSWRIDHDALSLLGKAPEDHQSVAVSLLPTPPLADLHLEVDFQNPTGQPGVAFLGIPSQDIPETHAIYSFILLNDGRTWCIKRSDKAKPEIFGGNPIAGYQPGQAVHLTIVKRILSDNRMLLHFMIEDTTLYKTEVNLAREKELNPSSLIGLVARREIQISRLTGQGTVASSGSMAPR